jgi:hypothetical protein
MTTNLAPQDRADLARFLREAIEADRYPFSPRGRRLTELSAKIGSPRLGNGWDCGGGSQ